MGNVIVVHTGSVPGENVMYFGFFQGGQSLNVVWIMILFCQFVVAVKPEGNMIIAQSLSARPAGEAFIVVKDGLEDLGHINGNTHIDKAFF